MIHQPITAARWSYDDYPTCPDCGSAAQGRGYFGALYCGLCERSIVTAVPLTDVTVSADGRSVWA